MTEYQKRLKEIEDTFMQERVELLDAARKVCLCVPACMHVPVCVCACLFAWLCVCVCVCVYVCVSRG